ncbi:glycoside hydrolase family 26 protein [Chelativorans alearense]|uniref:glycoside hydrolase family 26 protein n=1 Tax=Chelativorans alearense TaxID=2681495 RepID=UPI0013D310B1|nr:beta-mannosidase [Chelativorans alearense]
MLRPIVYRRLLAVAQAWTRVTVMAFAALCLAEAHANEPAPGRDMMQTTSIGRANGAGRTQAAKFPLFGIYDPHGRFRGSSRPQIEHVFVYWQALDKRMLAGKMRLAEEKGRTLMVTVEPYTKAANWRDGGERLFDDIIAGRFDAEITSICGMIASFPGEQWIRWGHEMEDPTGRYPWARDDARGYVAAYRKFVETCRDIAPRARFIWSPKGERGLAGYYPGTAYVDMVGLSVWGLEKWDRDWYGRPRGFTESFAEKYTRVERFGKPVIIAELGVAGGKAYRRTWMSQVLASAPANAAFPLLTSVVYFNDKEPHYWPNGYGSPDWRLSASVLADAPSLAASAR